jgi:hypothetical protein
MINQQNPANINVFSALLKFGPGAEENYLTESLVFLLRLLLERIPDKGLPIINRLCGLPRETQFKKPGTITLNTQVTVEQGRPDIEIRGGEDTLVFVEVKHDSPLGTRQLEYYRDKLRESGASKTGLVLLTRSRISARETSLPKSEYHHVCWYEVYNWLSSVETQDQVCLYLIHSFMSFLEEKQMNMTQVTWEYIEGVPALINLTNMMEAALAEVQPQARLSKTAGWDWRGFYVDSTFFYAVYYSRPLTIVFENDQGNNPTYKRYFDLQAVHFFSLTKDEQFEQLVEFVRQAYEGAPQAGPNAGTSQEAQDASAG